MKKNNYWQFIRGICIVMVILIHTLYITDSNLYNIFNIFVRAFINFAVAVFIFMAGYFTNVIDKKQFYKKKVIRLLIPLVIWNIIYFGIYYIGNNNIGLRDILKTLILSSAGNHLYYIYVLVQLFFIAPFLKKFTLKYSNSKIKYFPLVISLIYDILLFVFEYVLGINFPIYQYWLFGWFSFYYLGMIIRDMPINEKKILRLIIISFILSVSAGIIIYTTKNMYQFSITQLSIFNFFYSMGICMFIYLKRDSKVNETNIIVKLGDYSFGIFLSHVLVLRIIKKIFSLITLNYYINIIVMFLLILSITYILNMIYYEIKKGKKYGEVSR